MEDSDTRACNQEPDRDGASGMPPLGDFHAHEIAAGIQVGGPKTRSGLVRGEGLTPATQTPRRTSSLEETGIGKARQMRQRDTQALLHRREQQRALWAALRWVEEGRSLSGVAQQTGLHRLTLEKALLAAKERQEAIRRHLQTRGPLTSLLCYPDRGPWGQGSYFGNCTGYLIVDLLDYYQPQTVFDPMEGSGTTGEVCFDFKVDYVGCDLWAGFDLLSSPLPAQTFELIFWHPPYWPGHRYSSHPNDFSTAKTYAEYLERLREGLRRLQGLLSPSGHLVLVIGDGRRNGVFYPIHADILRWNLLPLDTMLIKEGDHHRRARHYRYGPTAFIPTLHEYVLVFKRGAE